MAKKRISRSVSNKKRYNLSFSPEIFEPFQKVVHDGGYSVSSVFEGVAEVFLNSMRPGEDFRSEYHRMMTLYFNYRRNNFILPASVEDDID